MGYKLKLCDQVLFFLLIIMLSTSCRSKYSGDVKYLDVDSINNTPIKKNKFEELKNKFLQIWLDSTNCYVEHIAQSNKPTIIWDKKNIKEVRVSNILHSANYDTLLVLATWYASEKNDDSALFAQTVSIGMGVIVDSNGKWNFKCNGGTYTRYFIF